MGFWKPVLDMTVTGPRFLLAWTLLSSALLACLLLKKRNVRWFALAAGALATGTAVGLGVLWYCVFVDNTFGGPLIADVWFWAPASFAAIALAIANFRGGRWWRTVLAAGSVPVFIATAAFQVNASYGLNQTLGSVLNINTANTVRIPLRSTWLKSSERPLYETWTAPADMPQTGLRGKTPLPIPAKHSGFQARWSGLYLPPAALVKHPPLLPFVIMMMGQPGAPSPQPAGNVADAMAAQNHGLAPIILVVDQLGDPYSDPLCLDSNRGKVESYVMQDVLPWARANLPILQDRKHWAFAGYSDGGVCASYFAAKYPQDFGSYISISGEEFQGSEKPAYNLATVFGGNQAEYDAVKPENIMRAHGRYEDMVGVYTAGSKDPDYTKQAQRMLATALGVGIRASFFSVPGAGHVRNAVAGGLAEAFRILYPRWGLSPS
ncbi:alpha/beta hydrolase [Arthrobacter silvisoli]|uniref:alpha/beta hydrolase n=1 Tax=Arthrobacter silvisoli TaxID=2291022 RepID=UPI001444068C|nr:alpha/beta hydrolase-fold protein [Arthrobacter silvisoli]